MTNSIKIRGQFRMVCRDKDGNLKWDTGFVHNGITTAGKALIASLAGDPAAVPFTYIALGSGTTAFLSSQTALVTEITTSGLGRASATVSRVTTTSTNDTLQLTQTFTASGSQTVQEIGIFNGPAAGTMLGRALTGAKGMVSGDTLATTYQVIFA